MSFQKLTSDKARIAQAFAWERAHCTTQEQVEVLDSMLERLATTIFGNRSRIQRNEFLRFAKYKQPLASVTELYTRYLQGHEKTYVEAVN
jgi:hypothetical protein